jgi:hypothetical protein
MSNEEALYLISKIESWYELQEEQMYNLERKQ